MDTRNMKSQVEQRRAHVERIQTMINHIMAKMAAADAAMKNVMATQQANLNRPMELPPAVFNHLQIMTDRMQKMAGCVDK